MRVSIGCGAAVAVGLMSVAVMFAPSVAPGQQIAEPFHLPAGIGATVSVATLRIPEKAWKHFAKAKAAAEHNRLAEADRETEKAIAIAPDFAQAYLLRADSEVQEHSFEAAIAHVREARRVEPDAMWAGVILAGAYNGLHQYEEVRRVLAGLHGREAETWQAAYEGARAAVGLKDAEGALRLSAITLDSAPPSFSDARLVRTNAFLLAQRWREAEEQMEIYLQSKVPEGRRAEVSIALSTVRERAREEELHNVASR